MTLRKKTLLIIGVMLIGLIAMLYAVSQTVFVDSFSKLEKQDTSQNVERALGALSDDISNLNAIVGDWAPWDDTYAFVEDVNNSYVENNLNDNTFANLRVNLMLFINSSGQIVFGKAFDLQNKQEVPVPESLEESLSASNLLTYHPNADSNVSGLLLIPECPMLISSQPILTSQNRGPIRGTLIMGRYLDSAEVESLAETTRLSLTFQRLDEPQIPSDFEAARSALSENEAIFVRPLDSKSVAGYTLIKDIYGEPVLVLRADMPRAIYQQGQTSLIYFISLLVGVSLLFVVVVVVLLERFVLSPLSRLNASVRGIGAGENLSAQVAVGGRDEVSSLGGEINRMLKALKRSQEAQRESELVATTTIEGMADGVMLVNMEGKVTYVNKAFEKLLGHKAEEIVGTSALELPTYRSSKDRERAREALKMIVENGSAKSVDMTAITKDGEEIPISFNASVIKDAQGNPQTLVAILRDVTERRWAEEELRRREEYFRALTENASDGVVILDRDGIVSYESPSMERVPGRKPGEGVGKSLLEFAHPDDAAKIAESLAELVQSPGHTLHTEIRMLHGDGSWRIIEVVCKNLLDNPAVSGIVVNARDVTKRKNAEEALQQSELNYRVLFDSTLDGLFVVDSETMKVVLANESGMRMAKIYGFDSLTNLNIADMLELFHSEDRDRVTKTIAEDMFEKDLRQINEFRMLTKDGREMWISAVGTRTKYQGKLAGLVSMRDITERKQMEEELRRLSDAVKMTSESIAIADLKGRIVDINEAGLRMYGLDDRADLVGKNPFDIIVPEDQPRALENMSKIVGAGSVKDIEYHITRKDGSKVLIETSVSLIKGEKGEPKGIVAVARDITERRRMEEDLKESEERFRAIFDNSVDGILVTDLETNSFHTCNKAMCQMLGYNLEEMRNLKVADIHPKKDLSYVIEEMERERQGESPQGVKVLPLVKKDGSVLHAEVTPSLVTFAGRHYLAGIFRDISERKQAEEALKSSEERYRLVVDNAAEGIVVAQEGMLKFFNSRATDVLGYSREEMASKPFIELVHPDDQQMVVGSYMARLEGKEVPPIYSFRVVDKAGNFRWVEINAIVINWEGGPATLNFLTDITERKKVEEEKQRMEEQLLRAGRLAAVGELSAGVAHELNNPIAAIQGFAQLLAARNDLDETTKKDLGIVYREAQRAAKITQNLLSFARRHEPEKHFVSLNEVVEKTLELQAYQMNVNNIEVVVDFAADLPKTMADFFQMQQVFVNLVSNAEQAMVGAHGKGRLVVKTQRVGDMIQTSFADDGPGISEENLKRIFDPFFTTKEVGKGTGLGLSICYGLVEAHGGRIYARSKLGEGATFVVEIPIVSEVQ